MKLDAVLAEMERFAAVRGVPVIERGGAAILERVVRERQPLSVLEIGAAIGYSALLMARRLPADAKITTLELDVRRAESARAFIAAAGCERRINVLVGDAAAIIPQLKDSFDLVFIDAAKGQYLDYFNKVLSKLLPDSVIVADNVLFRGLVESREEPPRRYRTIVRRLRAYLDLVNDHPHFETTVYHTGDGVAVSYYRGKKK